MRRGGKGIAIGGLLAMAAICIAGCGKARAPMQMLAADQPIRVEARVDKAVAAVGDRVVFTLQAVARKNVDVRLPQAIPAQTGIEIKDAQTPEPKKLGSDQVLWRREWTVTPEKPGAYIFPALEIPYKADAEKQDKKLKTASVYLDVRSVLKEGDLSGDIKDIKGPAELPSKFWMWLLIAGAGLGLLAAAIFAYRHWAGRKPVAPPLLPHEWALAELQKLSAAGLLAAGNHKEFAQRLSDIFRSYVEKRFAIMAPERTTEEFIVEMRGRKEFTPEQHALLGKLLAFCDMIKFAKYAPTEGEMMHGVDIVRNFVMETKPVVTTKEGNGWRAHYTRPEPAGVPRGDGCGRGGNGLPPDRTRCR